MSTRDNTFIDADKRMIYIHDDIDSDSISKICFYLLQTLKSDSDQEDKEKNFERKPIHMYINSYGGSVDDMWAIVDIMLGSKTPIYTYSTSHADSCGFFIFIAGKKRFITKHTKMCVHQFSGLIRGTYQEMLETKEQLDRLWVQLEQYVTEQTKISKERLNEIKEKKLDWYVYADESIGFGVATDIISEF